MVLSEYNALQASSVSLDAAKKDKLMSTARSYRDIASSQYSSMSGADQSEAYKYDLLADCYGTIASGKDVEATLAWAKGAWSEYALKIQASVNAAPKTRNGPYSGTSSIHYRWVSVEAWDACEVFVRSMVSMVSAS